MDKPQEVISALNTMIVMKLVDELDADTYSISSDAFSEIYVTNDDAEYEIKIVKVK